MKFAEKVLAFVGCLAVGAFLSCASSIKQENEKVSERPDLGQIARIGKAATVQIGSLSVEGPPSSGSGFFIRQDLIVTNVHVISEKSYAGAVSVAKLVNKPTWYMIEGVMASDPKRDLAILKVVKTKGEDAQILSLGDSGTVQTGDRIIVIGNPGQDGKFLQGDVSVGSISRRTPNFLDFRARNIRQGYSGGPVLNVHGDVIGITFQKHRVSAGYAIPSNYLRELLKDLPTQPKPLEKWREEPLIHYYSAVEAANRGELASAIKDYDTTIRIAPDFADAYIYRGEARQKLGDLEGAIEDYNTAIRLGDDYAYVYVNRGTAKANLGNEAAAIKDYDKAIFLDSAYTDALLKRANAKYSLEDYKGAIKDYDAVIRSKPNDTVLALIYVKRGRAMSELGDNEGAIEDCNMTIGLKPVDILLAAAYNLRGGAKSAQGDNEDSIIDYDKAIQLEPDYAEFYYNRGVANADLGRTEEAKADFKTALELLDKEGSISKSVGGEISSDLRLEVRPDLKVDIEKALRDLE